MSRPAVVVSGILLLCACQPDTTVAPPVEPPPHVNHPPTAQIGAPAIAREGSLVPFSSFSWDPDGDTLNVIWDFGDGGTLVTTEPTVSHVYRNNGTYDATLIVSDSHGAADTISKTVTIANVEPQITLLRIPDTAVTAGAPVEIEIQYHDPGLDDTVHAMIWINRPGSGEGSGLLGPGIVVRRFFAPDQYTIGVMAWDNDGAITERSADHPLVVVAAAPSAHLVAGNVLRRALARRLLSGS